MAAIHTYIVHIFFIKMTSRVELALSDRPYKRWDLGHYKRNTRRWVPYAEFFLVKAHKRPKR